MATMALHRNPSRLDPRWILACLGVGAALRLFHLGHQSLWIDELISLESATWASGAEFWRGLLHEIHGPLTSMMLHGWARLTSSEAGLRALYVIPAILTIPLAARFARDLAGETAGKVAGAAFALSPFHVWYSQEIRGYSWAILFSTASLVFFLRVWDDVATPRDFAGLAFCLALGILSNFAVALLFVALTALVLVRRPFRRARLLAWGGVVLVVGLLFLPWFLDWYGRVGGERVFADAPGARGIPLREAAGFSPAAIPYTLWTFAFGYSLGPTLHDLHLDRSWKTLAPHAPVLVIGGFAIASGMVLGARALAERGRLGLVAGLAIVPLALVMLLTLRDVKTFHPRYLVAVFPVFVALLAAGWARGGAFARVSAGTALGLALVALGNHYFDARYAKEDSRAAAHSIRELEKPGDAVVVIYSFRPFQYYFLKEGGTARLLHLHKRFLRTDEELRAHALDAASGGGRVWLVLSRWWDVAPESRLRAAFESALVERGRWNHPGVLVTLYEGARS